MFELQARSTGCSRRTRSARGRKRGRRTPLWQQRQRSADLLRVARQYPSFPILLETTRECVRDVFDLPALKKVLRDIRARRIRMVAVDLPKVSPFASSL